ncbi:hypothetical protein LX36DRAFT_651298 [Colletotrichum falcatum]|nr:hypothetical protein LX36DRAFT_651298 [Colletotrichum falcatum]
MAKRTTLSIIPFLPSVCTSLQPVLQQSHSSHTMWDNLSHCGCACSQSFPLTCHSWAIARNHRCTQSGFWDGDVKLGKTLGRLPSRRGQ